MHSFIYIIDLLRFSDWNVHWQLAFTINKTMQNLPQLFFLIINYIQWSAFLHSLPPTKTEGSLHRTFWNFWLAELGTYTQLGTVSSLLSPALMIEFFLPNSRALLPTFRINCPDWSHLVQMGYHFAQNTTTNPCSLLSHHKPLSGICMYTKCLQPHPKTPLFLVWNWKWAKWTIVWAKRTLTGQNVWKVGKKIYAFCFATESVDS